MAPPEGLYLDKQSTDSEPEVHWEVRTTDRRFMRETNGQISTIKKLKKASMASLLRHY